MSKRKPTQRAGRPPDRQERRPPPRISDRIIPRPELRRQLAGRDLMVFWRDAADPGRRQGLALTIAACASPTCPCRAVQLDGIAIGDAVASIETDGRALRISGWPNVPTVDRETRRVHVEVDVETGDCELLGTDSDPDLLRWLTAEIDGELLDRLHERWRLAKGWPGRSGPRPDMALCGWQPGELLGFDQVFDRERVDRFVVEGASYWAHTFLCPIGSCDCRAAEVVFIQNDGDADIGCIRLALGSGTAQVVSEQPEVGREPLCAELWRRFSARHDVGAYLGQREARMRMAWLAIEQALRAAGSRPAFDA